MENQIKSNLFKIDLIEMIDWMQVNLIFKFNLSLKIIKINLI